MDGGLTDDQRNTVAGKIMEWGNLLFAGLVVSQGLSQSINYSATLLGTVGLLFAYFLASRVMRGGAK